MITFKTTGLKNPACILIGRTGASGMKHAVHWAHAPEHRLGEQGAYMVTSGTYEKAMLFAGEERLSALCGGLLKYAARHGWALQAWAVFPNHYHFIAFPPDTNTMMNTGAVTGIGTGAARLPAFLRELHSRSARWLNTIDRAAGRKVWHNYWDTHLSYEASYYARLHYVHQNAVKHGVTLAADQYPWCSAGWFARMAAPAFRRTVESFKTDTVKVEDDF
jgi:putative transposase